MNTIIRTATVVLATAATALTIAGCGGNAHHDAQAPVSTNVPTVSNPAPVSSTPVSSTPVSLPASPSTTPSTVATPASTVAPSKAQGVKATTPVQPTPVKTTAKPTPVKATTPVQPTPVKTTAKPVAPKTTAPAPVKTTPAPTNLGAFVALVAHGSCSTPMLSTNGQIQFVSISSVTLRFAGGTATYRNVQGATDPGANSYTISVGQATGNPAYNGPNDFFTVTC